ncbi:MAG: helix-turn-helix domain-containing protein [Ignavibacteriales bacterium]|nr:helix-turn-helix domain-containing protein [Ignavibacteriales bacterium]
MKFFDVNNLQKDIEEIKSLLRASSFEPLDIEGASKYLKITKASLYQLVHRKRIPYYKPTGGKVYFNKYEINSWILNAKMKTYEDIEKEWEENKRNKK